MVLSFSACKDATVDGNASTASTLQSGEQLNASSGSNDNQNFSSGIELEDDVFDSEDITDDNESTNMTSGNNDSSNIDNENSSTEDDGLDTIPEFDGEIELPMDKFD